MPTTLELSSEKLKILAQMDPPPPCFTEGGCPCELTAPVGVQASAPPCVLGAAAGKAVVCRTSWYKPIQHPTFLDGFPGG